MSITVRSWSDKELKDIYKGKDKFWATVFMNVKTFSRKEMRHYPYHLRRTYHVYFKGQTIPISVYATDKKSLMEFLDAEYNLSHLESIDEVITTSKRIL